MISGFQIALKNTIDVIAPPATPLQDFTYHWKQLMKFYASHKSNCKVPIESTGIPQHLNCLLEILLNEEKESDNPGPCLEYLLQHKLLAWLTTLASVETPPGMRLVCLLFFKKLLARTKFPLLHQAAVYGPVLRLISLCSGHVPSPIEGEEIKFLLTLCFLICRYPHLTNIINDSNNIPQESNVIKCDTERFDIHSVTYIPTKTKNNINPLFEPLNTQAITLINPNLFACDNQRRKSICSERLKLFGSDVMMKKMTKDSDKIKDRSNESTPSRVTDNSSECSSPMLDKQSQDNGACKALNDDHISYESCEKVSSEASSTVDIEKKLQAFEELGVTSNFSQNNDINIYESEKQNESNSLDNNISSNLLLNALISYLNSADNTVRVRACEGIMVLATLEDPSFACTMAKSDLAKVVANRLENLFNSIPAHVDPAELDEIDFTWGLDSPLWTNDKKFPGCRQVAAYFMWLDYCDQLIKEAHPDVAQALGKSIRVLFFEKVLTPALANHHVVLITALITETLKKITASLLSIELGYWLVGEQRDPVITDPCAITVVERLVENCYTESDDLILETLKLFEEIIDKKNEHVLNCMIFSFLTSRGYYDNAAADSVIASWSDEEDEREREKKGSLDFSQEQTYSRTLAPSNIHRIINCFLSLMPRQLQTDPGEDNYERYMADWEKQYIRVKMDCVLFAWPLEAVSTDDSGSYDSRPEADHCSSRFYVGPFICMLLDKVSNIPNQKYEMNLQLTVVISKLALFPHPYLHEFFLNPLIPLAPGTKSLFICLQKVIKQLVSEVTKITKYKEILKETRRKLLEDSSQESVKTNILYESIIITEEFCKELAAIAYIKYQHSM